MITFRAWLGWFSFILLAMLILQEILYIPKDEEDAAIRSRMMAIYAVPTLYVLLTINK